MKPAKVTNEMENDNEENIGFGEIYQTPSFRVEGRQHQTNATGSPSVDSSGVLPVNAQADDVESQLNSKFTGPSNEGGDVDHVDHTLGTSRDDFQDPCVYRMTTRLYFWAVAICAVVIALLLLLLELTFCCI